MKLKPTWLLASLATVTPVAANAQESVVEDPVHGMFAVDSQDPEGHLPPLEEATKHPLDYGYLLMELNERGLAAVQAKDYRSALKFHRAAAKMVPNRAISFSTVCTDYEKLGERDHAAAACSHALYLDGAKLADFVHFVHLVASRPGGLDAREVSEAKAAIAHLKNDDKTKLAGFELQCELGLGARDPAALSACSAELRKQAPTHARAIGFAWAGAMLRKDYAGANALLRDAKRDGVDPARIERMTRTTEAAERGEPIDLTPSASAVAIDDVSDDDEPTATPSAPTTSSPSLHLSVDRSPLMHPMLRWLLALCGVLFVCVMFARRFGRSA